MDRLRSMEVFVAVADAGSFAAVAQAFDISPVMVGKHIAYLEQRLGSRLLHRTTRRQSLSAVGKEYCEQCRQILAQVKAAETGVEAMRAAPRGLLRISAPVTYGTEKMAAALTDYLERHQEVSVDLNLSDRYVDVIEEGFDAAIRVGAVEDESLVARPLAPFEVMVCASPAYLKKFGRPKTPDDLRHHRCLDFTHWQALTRWRLRDDGGVAVAPGRFRSNSGAGLRHAAIAGFGLIMQSAMMLEEDVRAGRLAPVLAKYTPPPRAVSLVYPSERRPSAKMTSFVDFMLERFGI